MDDIEQKRLIIENERLTKENEKLLRTIRLIRKAFIIDYSLQHSIPQYVDIKIEL